MRKPESQERSRNQRTTRREFLRASGRLAAGIALAGAGLNRVEAAPAKRRVIVWSEGSAPKNVYPNDINAAIAEGLRPLKGWDIRTASLSEPEQGLPDALLQSASVLIWWGHVHHNDVQDALVQRIVRRVKEEGMGFLATHSAHWSKPF
ncbi:MAG TPA: hypothetical protein VFB21_23500, partial [Chthonomonadaceae bacterium]|nr:hypothetical protein [Chthonomonadaceae bacterium]